MCHAERKSPITARGHEAVQELFGIPAAHAVTVYAIGRWPTALWPSGSALSNHREYYRYSTARTTSPVTSSLLFLQIALKIGLVSVPSSTHQLFWVVRRLGFWKNNRAGSPWMPINDQHGVRVCSVESGTKQHHLCQLIGPSRSQPPGWPSAKYLHPLFFSFLPLNCILGVMWR